MNIRKLRKLERWILAEPRRFDMQNWFGDAQLVKELNPPCGTVGCLAGMACSMEGVRQQEPATRSGYVVTAKNEILSAECNATMILGLSDFQAARLFYMEYQDCDYHWPMKFEKAYFAAKTQKQKVKVAVARIEHFIKTKGAE